MPACRDPAVPERASEPRVWSRLQDRGADAGGTCSPDSGDEGQEGECSIGGDVSSEDEPTAADMDADGYAYGDGSESLVDMHIDPNYLYDSCTYDVPFTTWSINGGCGACAEGWPIEGGHSPRSA